MTALALAVKIRALFVWDYIRAVMGDKAYEGYLEVTRRTGTKPLSAEDFYLDSVNRRYSSVSRCC